MNASEEGRRAMVKEEQEEEDDSGNTQGQWCKAEKDQKLYEIFLREQYLKKEFMKWKEERGELESEEEKIKVNGRY